MSGAGERGSVRRSRRRGSRLSPHEQRLVFLRMVEAELERGLLRYSRRRQLVRFAQALGLSEFEASLLIAEAQYNAGQADDLPEGLDTSAVPRPTTHPEHWPVAVRFLVAVICGLTAQFFLMWWLAL